MRRPDKQRGFDEMIIVDEPNELTYAAIEEAERMLNDPDVKKFSSVEELFAELDE